MLKLITLFSIILISKPSLSCTIELQNKSTSEVKTFKPSKFPFLIDLKNTPWTCIIEKVKSKSGLKKMTGKKYHYTNSCVDSTLSKTLFRSNSIMLPGQIMTIDIQVNEKASYYLLVKECLLN